MKRNRIYFLFELAASDERGRTKSPQESVEYVTIFVMIVCFQKVPG